MSAKKVAKTNRPKWRWSAWYTSEVAAHNRALAAPKSQEDKRELYAEWLAARNRVSLPAARAVVESLVELSPSAPLTAEQCQVDAPAPDQPPKPVTIGGVRMQPKWHWSKGYRQHVAATLNSHLRPMPSNCPMKQEVQP